MKKIYISLRMLFVALAISILVCSAASAQTFVSLSQLQRHLETHSPSQSVATGPHRLNTKGTIESITWAGDGNHYNMILLVDDAKAYKPIGSDSPRLCVHFRLHKDQPPFQAGDVVTVSGALNELYSSVMIPWILADTVNGSADF